MIRHLVNIPLRNFPMKIFAMQQLMTNSLVTKVHISVLMARPYEIVDMTNICTQDDTKLPGKPNG